MLQKTIFWWRGLDRKRKRFLGGLVILATIILVMFFGRGGGGESELVSNLPIGQEQEAQWPSGENLPLEVSADITTWKKYENTGLGYGFLYPSNAKLSETSIGTSVIVSGLNEVAGSEHGDSVYLVFNRYSLDGRSLREVVEQKEKNYYDSATDDLVEGITAVRAGDRSGYFFRTSEYRYLYFEDGEDGYLLVVDGTKDSENLGYTKIVDGILSSLE